MLNPADAPPLGLNPADAPPPGLNPVELLIFGAARELAMRPTPEFRGSHDWTRWISLRHCARMVEREGRMILLGYAVLSRSVDGAYYLGSGRVDGHA